MEPSEENFDLYSTIEEAAAELELSISSVRRMISDDDLAKRLPSRMATEAECAKLFSAVPSRIKGIPGTGIRLIHQDTIAAAKKRQKRGRPATKLPKNV